MKLKQAILCTGCLALCLGGLATAQEQGARQAPPSGRPIERVQATPAEIARKVTDEMNEVLSLSKQQYKKLYKLHLSEEKAKAANRPSGERPTQGERPSGMPAGQGGPQGMGGGGPQGFGGGGPGMGGGPQGFGGGGPGIGSGPQGMGGAEPNMSRRMGTDPTSDEYITAKEEKLKKILSREQYAAWRKRYPDPYGILPKGVRPILPRQ